MFPCFAGSIALFQIFQAPENIKEKIKLFKSNKLRPYDEEEEKVQSFESIVISSPDQFRSYNAFLTQNLLENVKRKINIAVEIYPRN